MKLQIVQDGDAACSAPRRLKAKDVVGLTALLRALSDETRLQIATLLASAGDAVCACDIEARFDLSQPTISHHLKVLREAGIISGEKRGSWVYYTLDKTRVDALQHLHALLSG